MGWRPDGAQEHVGEKAASPVEEGREHPGAGAHTCRVLCFWNLLPALTANRRCILVTKLPFKNKCIYEDLSGLDLQDGSDFECSVQPSDPASQFLV